MYVTHPPDKHTEWLERKEKFRRDKKEQKGTGNSNSDSTRSNTSEKKALALSDKLKATMVTTFCCSDVDAEKLWKNVVNQSN